MRPALPLANSLPHAADFMIAVLESSAEAPNRRVSWVEINRLAARWLRPEPGCETADTSRLGHAVVAEMARHNMVETELTTAADGAVMIRDLVHAQPANHITRLAA